LIEDARFTDNAARTKNHDALDSIFGEWIAARTADEVLQTLNDDGAAIAPIYDISEIFHDPHFAARGNIASVPDPELGTIRMQNVVSRLSRTPGKIDHAGPKLGEHNDEVYRNWLEMEPDEIDTLRRDRVI
jgi:formyl-CoA transferase